MWGGCWYPSGFISHAGSIPVPASKVVPQYALVRACDNAPERDRAADRIKEGPLRPFFYWGRFDNNSLWKRKIQFQVETKGTRVRIPPAPQMRKNKYGNQRIKAYGLTFASKLEYRYYTYLGYRQRAGEIKNFLFQVKEPLNVHGILIANMIIDFKIINNDDSVEYHDTKGAKPTPDWKLKAKLFNAITGYTVKIIGSKDFSY